MKSFNVELLGKELAQAVSEAGYKEPTSVQAKAIPELLRGHDIVAQSKTGTGKTAAFLLPAIRNLDISKRQPQVLVITPTRELCVQVTNEARKFGRHLQIRAVSVYGGASINGQIDLLNRGAQIVIGTPGRLIDLYKRKNLRLNNISSVILDEADRMLDMGFIDDIRFLLTQLPRQRQTCLFSATMPPNVLHIAKRFMNNPNYLLLSKDEVTVKKIKQYYCGVSRDKKFDALLEILDDDTVDRVLIFCNTKIMVKKLAYKLRKEKIFAKELHGDLTQKKRDIAMSGFKNKHFHLLIATDVAARGLDIDDISHVINYDIPEDPKTYVHRIGRTARAGKGGHAITFITTNEQMRMRDIEHLTKVKINRLHLNALKIEDEIPDVLY